jgi:hypothetical protein
MKKLKHTPDKKRLIAEIKEAVQEMKLIKAGKKKSRSADDFIKEL